MYPPNVICFQGIDDAFFQRNKDYTIYEVPQKNESIIDMGKVNLHNYALTDHYYR